MTDGIHQLSDWSIATLLRERGAIGPQNVIPSFENRMCWEFACQGEGQLLIHDIRDLGLDQKIIRVLVLTKAGQLSLEEIRRQKQKYRLLDIKGCQFAFAFRQALPCETEMYASRQIALFLAVTNWNSIRIEFRVHNQIFF